LPASDDERIAAAQAYVDALVTHDGDAVPFAPHCTRVEQGMKNGFSGNHLRRSLNRAPQYRVIGATTAPEYTVDGDEVTARYDVLTKVSVRGRRMAAHVDETFLIPARDGRIHHIRVRFRPFLARA
jgi:ketosteroid isomerase-like protein